MSIGLRIGSLFSGIGGLELGLERAGVGHVVWQCELDLVCGGFPCQDVSSAGKRRGLGGQRSGLWYHFARVLSEVRPAWVVVENVASGVRAWLPSVRRHLCELGYRTRPLLLSAADVGAPHLRKRVFVVAHANGQGKPARPLDAEVAGAPPPAADLASERKGGAALEGEERRGPWAEPQPAMVRMVHGVPRRVDRSRRRALGNAVVPQCAEVVGRVIVDLLTQEGARDLPVHRRRGGMSSATTKKHPSPTAMVHHG